MTDHDESYYEDNCPYFGVDGPCWGEVQIADELYNPDNNEVYEIYACAAHEDMAASQYGKYRPKP